MRTIMTIRPEWVLSPFAAIALILAGCPDSRAQTTMKERLSDKASDQQRVDNCHVPPERRGAMPRPDCPPRPQAETTRTR
jgi:hypothetical protein